MVIKIAGMNRILINNYKVIESTTSKFTKCFVKSGKIIVNSQKLKNEIGKEVRVVIYARRKR